MTPARRQSAAKKNTVSIPLKTELHQAYVHGYVPHPVWSQDYRNVWLDLPRRRLADRARGTGRFGAALAPLGGRR